MQVTFLDKNKNIIDGIRNKFTDADINMIKNAVNSKADSQDLQDINTAIIQLQEDVQALTDEQAEILQTLASDNPALSTIQELVDAIVELQGGGGGGGGTVSTNVLVALPAGRTLGPWATGQTIPSNGKNLEQVLKLLAQSNVAPTVTLTSPTTIKFNQSAISNSLAFTKQTNSVGATIVTAVLEWRRNNSGAWTQLTNNLAATNYLHNLTDTSYNGQPFNYRYTVTDSNGDITVATRDITPGAYANPTLSGIVGNTETRELGNVNKTLVGTIHSNNQYVQLDSYQVQYNAGSGWFNVGAPIAASGASAIINLNHNDSALINSTQIQYRVIVYDGYQTSIANGAVLSLGVISFAIKSVLGYAVSNPDMTTLLNFGNPAFTNLKARTVPAVTAPPDNFTYYAYASSAGDLVNITDGLEAFLGAFTKLTDLAGVNSYGANVSYRIYKSNATEAFTNVNLSFS